MSTEVKLTEPKVEERSEQPYVGIRAQVPMSRLGEHIPMHIDEVFGWLSQQGIAPAGPPLARYYVIDMEGNLDIEIGVPVATSVTGDTRVVATSMPAGRYASLIYTGIENGIAGNAALLEWGAAQGLRWDQWNDPNGDAFGGRVEVFLHGPEDDPDPANWDTEVAIRLAD